MNRKELAFSVIGLIATFILPWPCAERPQVLEHTAEKRSVNVERGGGMPPLRLYGVLERVRTGPPAGLQPTR